MVGTFYERRKQWDADYQKCNTLFWRKRVCEDTSHQQRRWKNRGRTLPFVVVALYPKYDQRPVERCGGSASVVCSGTTRASGGTPLTHARFSAGMSTALLDGMAVCSLWTRSRYETATRLKSGRYPCQCRQCRQWTKAIGQVAS